MTYYELMTGLLEKGYQPPKCDDHMRGPYCCARAVLDDADLAASDPAQAEDMLRDFMELDRKAVFEAWYGSPEDKPFSEHWLPQLERANYMYSAGTIDTCVEFILKNP